MAVVQDEYRLLVGLVRDECERQMESAELPQGLRDALSERDILFGEHPEALVVLPLIMFQAIGGTNIKSIAPIGAAMEFLLAAADVLDDVQDMAIPDAAKPEERLHSHYINQIELLTALLLLGEQSVISLVGGILSAEHVTRAISIFNTFKLRAFSGQYADAHGRVGLATDIDTSLQITCGKSGSLGRCAAEMGAALATRNEETIKLAGMYGEHLAVARQFHDDVANLWPSTGRLEDLEQLKRTLPLTFALTKSQNGASQPSSSLQSMIRLEDAIGPNWHESLVSSEVMQAREEVFHGGGIHFAVLQALIHLVKARTVGRQIEKLPPGEGMLEHLASS